MTKRSRKRAIRPKVTADRLLLSVRQRRHRAALLKAASEWLVGTFTTAMGDREPRALIQERGGRVEPADPDVTLELTTELHMQAEELRRALVELLGKDLESISLDEVPVIEGTEPAAEEVPRTARRRQEAAE